MCGCALRFATFIGSSSNLPPGGHRLGLGCALLLAFMGAQEIKKELTGPRQRQHGWAASPASRGEAEASGRAPGGGPAPACPSGGLSHGGGSSSSSPSWRPAALRRGTWHFWGGSPPLWGGWWVDCVFIPGRCHHCCCFCTCGHADVGRCFVHLERERVCV